MRLSACRRARFAGTEKRDASLTRHDRQADKHDRQADGVADRAWMTDEVLWEKDGERERGEWFCCDFGLRGDVEDFHMETSPVGDGGERMVDSGGG